MGLGKLDDDTVRNLITSARRQFTTHTLDQYVAFCDGDPLVTQILVQRLEDPLAGTGATPISQVIADPLGYILREWYERVLSSAEPTLKPLLHRLLATFSTAYGPLARDELAIILDATAGQIDELLSILGTLIAGNRVEGYGFAHSRMADVLAPVFGSGDPSIAQGFVRLIEASLIKADREPAEVSSYALRHTTAHLLHGGVPVETMSRLLSTPWLRAHQICIRHVREFVTLADAVGQKAREANALAAASVEAKPLATLEFAATLWWSTAQESMSLLTSRTHSARDASLRAIRETLFRVDRLPPVNPTDELEKLISLKDELSPEIKGEGQALADAAADITTQSLFSTAWDDDKAVRLLEQVHPKFDSEVHVRSLETLPSQITGWKYLLESGRGSEPVLAVQEIRKLADASGSSKVKADCAVFLAGLGEISFEDALKSVLVFAQVGYEASKTAALLASQLLEVATAPRNIAGFQLILARFQAAATESGVEAPLLGAMLRISPPQQRPAILEAVLRLQHVSDIEIAIENGPEDWSERAVNDFTRMIGGSESVAAEAGAAPALAEGRDDLIWRHALRVARILGCVAVKTHTTGRRVALERVLDNLERIPIAEWWQEPADVLDKILYAAQQCEDNTNRLRLRAEALAEAYEAKSNAPLANYGLPRALDELPPERQAQAVVDFINRWGKEGLKRALFKLESGPAALAMHLAESLGNVREPGLRREMAAKLVTNEGLSPALKASLVQSFKLHTPEEEKWNLWVRADRVSCCKLLNALAGQDADVTGKTLRWLIGKGTESQALLFELAIPNGWAIPDDLIVPLTSILRNWSPSQAGVGYPAALAARLPAVRLRDIVNDLLGDHEEEPLYWVADIMAEVNDMETASVIQKVYLQAVLRLPYSWANSWRLFRSIADRVPVIPRPADWLTSYLAYLQKSEDLTTNDIALCVAHDASRLSHPSLADVYRAWALAHANEIADPIRRTKMRFTLRQTLEPDAVDECLEFARACDDGTNEGLYELFDILPLLTASAPGDEIAGLIDRIVAEATEDNFDHVISALGDHITTDHIRTLIPHMLKVATFTGRQVPLAQYFARVPESERDVIFEGWCRALRRHGCLEDERRFLCVIADAATSTFALGILSDLFRADVNQSDWEKVILALLGRLSPEDADKLVEAVVALAKKQDSDVFLNALLPQLRRRDRLNAVRSCLPKLSSRAAKRLNLSFCSRNPALLDEKLVADALRMAEKDAMADLRWICEAPAATAAQRDQAWALLLARARKPSFNVAVSALVEAVHFLQDCGDGHTLVEHALAIKTALEADFTQFHAAT